jgi:hypothetical protein
MAMSNGALGKAKNAVVSVVQGAGDVGNPSRSAVTDIVVSTLMDVGEITSTALSVVTDAVRGALQGNKESASRRSGLPGPPYPGPGRPWARSAGRYQGRARGAVEQALGAFGESQPTRSEQ